MLIFLLHNRQMLQQSVLRQQFSSNYYQISEVVLCQTGSVPPQSTLQCGGAALHFRLISIQIPTNTVQERG